MAVALDNFVERLNRSSISPILCLQLPNLIMAQKLYGEELEKFKEYLKSSSNEDAKRPYLYPLFHKLFPDTFKTESDTHGADIYIEGKIIVESKTNYSQWLEGFYQALHYQRKFGLAYNRIMVIAHKFVAIWKVDDLPEEAVILAHKADIRKAPNQVGKENARATSKSLKDDIRKKYIYWLTPVDLEGDIFGGARNLTTESFEILKVLKNLDSNRLQVNTHNFIKAIERLKPFFAHPIEAVHAFYTLVAYWDITSTVAINPETNDVRVIGFKGQRFSDLINVLPRHVGDFKRFIETQYIFTNEGSGLTVDYYFSRFDEVLAEIDPEYVRQHGIFFTNDNLSKFALWFVKRSFGEQLEDDYIVFDPAGGSGNLVSSWKGKLKHKIISELQPDLLKIIDRRMKVDPFHLETGFTIIPRTSNNEGLNFLDKEASDYVAILETELALKHLALDKHIAFLLNPPYKNTDENQQARDEKDATYAIHPSILALTGVDAGRERYLGFLAQILNISKQQNDKNPLFKSLVMIFTPTSWLIPRRTYANFRKIWDQSFKFHSGFIVTSNEWFKLEGKWPLAFTIWEYDVPELYRENIVQLSDLTQIQKQDLNIDWNETTETITTQLIPLINKPTINFTSKKVSIKAATNQSMYDFKRDPTKAEKASVSIFGGLPLNDHRRFNRKTYGIANSGSVGFMDDVTPVRIKPNTKDRRFDYSAEASLWFRFDTGFLDVNKSKVLNGPPDQKGYCAFDLESAKSTCSWYAITKSLNGLYPVWANQLDIWSPNVIELYESEYTALCFAIVLSDNRCVVTTVEKDNPVQGAPEIFVENPLCPTNPNSFWNSVLASKVKNGLAKDLVNAVTDLYKYWNLTYCQGSYLHHVGLQDEPYFKYFDYPDYLTPHSGLIQIKKYAEINGCADLQDHFVLIVKLSKQAKERLYYLLVNEFHYFE
jgi:hypothetical protein